MKDITMTLSSPDVKLVNGKASLTASVSNGSAAPQRVVLGAFPGSEGAAAQSATWTTIGRPLRTIPAVSIEQYLVEFDTTGAAPGTYPVKLIAYSADEAPEEYSDQGHVISLVVEPQPVVPPKKFPWWIVIAGAALVLVIGAAVVFFLTRPATPKLTAVTVNPAAVTVPVGGTQQLTAAGSFSDGSTKPLAPAWRSADAGIVEVDSTGKVTARAPGSALITASQDGIEGNATASVPAVLTNITITPASATLNLGNRVKLKAFGIFSDGSTQPLTTVTWQSNNPSSAQVDDTGVVTAVSFGPSTVTASRDGIQGAANIFVQFILPF
ncbi:Ig-like domain-containing protein [Paenarthrobacter sp. PH39-S1]|uniref:Ig-like domain-containing protein n=1 Tax=Paenarthrobacter sp. PH39-S1 TaxID=3046204 RepID=UPI0024BA567A|nr:Ig-like domain-containing protein [Paenarthrobacter sp. PH39-S1]MDJ0355991.1 Ig-like domain-containing protein [Paenarthrobacter sp. PH39-S1]